MYQALILLLRLITFDKNYRYLLHDEQRQLLLRLFYFNFTVYSIITHRLYVLFVESYFRWNIYFVEQFICCLCDMKNYVYIKI